MTSTLLSCFLTLTMAGAAYAQTQVGLRTQSKDIDFSAASSTKPFRMGTAVPATCTTGETFLKTNAAPGANVYACTTANTWVAQTGASGLPDMTGQANRVLATDGSSASWRALGGDVSGAPDAAVVSGLQGRGVAATAPTDGQVLRWSSGPSQWQPYPAMTAGGPNYSQSFTSQTTIVIAGTTHGLGTANVIVGCYDNSVPALRITPSSITVHPATYDVTVTFISAQSGRCVLNGSGAAYSATTAGSNTFASGTTQTFQGALVASGAQRTAPAQAGTALPSTCTAGDQFFKTNAPAGQNLSFCTAANTWTQMSGSSQVSSVFGRTGTITAAVGDYSFSQVSGTAANSQIAPGVDAVKIGAGTVTNTVFGCLANVTGDLQSQLNAKAAATHTHTLSGDASGDIGTVVVNALQGRSVATTAPADGQALVWSASANTWQPATVSGGSGGTGMAAQLGDFAVSRTSPAVLTIGPNCSASTPCTARFGNTAYNFTRSCTATISSGSGTAYIYVSSGGTLTIGHNATVTASAGCMAQASTTNFPSDSIPLYTWTATSANWDSAGGHDFRAILSSKALSAGTGITMAESGGRTTVSVDTAVVPAYAAANATLDFASMANGACAPEQTFTLYGASPGDAIAPGWPAGLAAGLTGMMRVSATNTVAVRLCNNSGTTLDPASATFRAVVLH